MAAHPLSRSDAYTRDWIYPGRDGAAKLLISALLMPSDVGTNHEICDAGTTGLA
jgi:hypothetical protein